MLVLTRKLQERIKIGDNITLTVLRVKGQTVRIGIDAPRDVRVVRAELPAKSDMPVDGVAGGTTEVAAPNASPKSGSVKRTAKPSAQNRNAAASERSGSDPRLPQRKKFDRYSQPPLRLAACAAAVLAK